MSTVHKRSKTARLQAAKDRRKRALKHHVKHRLTPNQKKAIAKMQRTGVYGKIAKMREALKLPNSITGEAQIAPATIKTVISWANEGLKGKEEKETARDFAAAFISRDPGFLATDTGLAALQFEQLLAKHSPELLEKLVETIAESNQNSFIAVFRETIQDQEWLKVIEVAKEFCTLELLVNAGDKDNDTHLVSDIAIVEGFPNKGIKKKPVEAPSILPQTREAYEAVSQTGITESTKKAIYPHAIETREGFIDYNGAVWTKEGNKYKPVMEADTVSKKVTAKYIEQRTEQGIFVVQETDGMWAIMYDGSSPDAIVRVTDTYYTVPIESIKGSDEDLLTCTQEEIDQLVKLHGTQRGYASITSESVLKSVSDHIQEDIVSMLLETGSSNRQSYYFTQTKNTSAPESRVEALDMLKEFATDYAALKAAGNVKTAFMVGEEIKKYAQRFGYGLKDISETLRIDTMSINEVAVLPTQNKTAGFYGTVKDNSKVGGKVKDGFTEAEMARIWNSANVALQKVHGIAPETARKFLDSPRGATYGKFLSTLTGGNDAAAIEATIPDWTKNKGVAQGVQTIIDQIKNNDYEMDECAQNSDTVSIGNDGTLDEAGMKVKEYFRKFNIKTRGKKIDEVHDLIPFEIGLCGEELSELVQILGEHTLNTNYIDGIKNKHRLTELHKFLHRNAYSVKATPLGRSHYHHLKTHLERHADKQGLKLEGVIHNHDVLRNLPERTEVKFEPHVSMHIIHALIGDSVVRSV